MYLAWDNLAYEQARVLIGSLLTAYSLLLYKPPLGMSECALWVASYIASPYADDQARTLIGSLLIGYQLLLYSQPLDMSKQELWLALY